MPLYSPGRARLSLVLLLMLTATARGDQPKSSAGAGPFATFSLPPEWEARFWASADAKALMEMDLKAVAALVPVQAGIRFCRCPACDASEASDPLAWSVAKPKSLTCRACGQVVPNDTFPAKTEKDKKEPPEDTVEVVPGVVHHYPYHNVASDQQHYPDERLYLAAKADYEAREFLAKATLYAALSYRNQPAEARDPARARLAATLLLRFAQVYPNYATHFDQPQSAKHFGPANLAPPYRQGYGTAKWDWSGSLDVPLNLVIAYALIREEPAFLEAARTLDVARPHRLVENDLFRASASFVQRQPEPYNEATLQADRGLLAVGRLLNDPAILRDAQDRLERLAERGFYHDGFWRQGTLAAHRRVVNQLDGWMERFLARTDVPMLQLAETASAGVLANPPSAEVLQAAWPASPLRTAAQGPMLLGGAGLARLSVGQGPQALDLELRSLDAFGPDRVVRQALRLGVGGRLVLDDLDESPPLASGFDRSSAAHNTVIVDGLNHRESLARAHEPAPGGNFLFFAADPDFQAVTLDDPRAYPQSVTRYRQTLVASGGARSRYAISVFEVRGGLQHDQLVHGTSGTEARWEVDAPTGAPTGSLLPPGLPFVATSRAADLRWFIQSYGELTPIAQAAVTRPTVARLLDPTQSGVRLHLLGDTPLSAILATGPDPSRATSTATEGRPLLLLRRRRTDGGSLVSILVTVYEPVVNGRGTLRRVGRVATQPDAVVVYLESDDGVEHLVINLSAGTLSTVVLADGSRLTTDGLAVRVNSTGITLAGGTVAEHGRRRATQSSATGSIVAVGREPGVGSRGWFESDRTVEEPEALSGRVLLIRHGDGTTRGWTLQRVENTSEGHARFHVREEPGFMLETTGDAHRPARYYQFPRGVVTGPHTFRIGKMTRSTGN